MCHWTCFIRLEKEAAELAQAVLHLDHDLHSVEERAFIWNLRSVSVHAAY